MKEHVRNSVKAVIITDGKILLLQKRDGNSLYSVLPGGGQKTGEPLPEALRRECLEEINARVVVGELPRADYISGNHALAEVPRTRTRLNSCLPAASDDYQPRSGPTGPRAAGVVGAASALEQANFYPRAVVPYLRQQSGRYGLSGGRQLK